MMRLWRLTLAAWSMAALGNWTDASSAAEPEIVSVQKIWDAGEHNAFTDLIRWHDKWYCTFRESAAHVGGDGKLRVLESADGDTWRSAALISEKGIDLRDPKLSTTPDDRLMIVAGGSVYEGKTLTGRQPRVTFSKDGQEWTPPQRVLEEGDWLWRVTWNNGKAYGVSYTAAARSSPAAQEAAKTGKVESGPADWKLKLFESSDGVHYTLVTYLDVPGHPNETTLRFLPDGEMVALVRREGGNTFGWIGHARAPYKDWTWHETKHRIGGPNFLRLPDGTLWAACRSYPGGAKTVLARLTLDGDYEPKLTFPSGGDNSYAGLVWHDGLLWMSYYSSHEGKTSIYLAKIKIPLQTAAILKALEDAQLVAVGQPAAADERAALDDACRAAEALASAPPLDPSELQATAEAVKSTLATTRNRPLERALRLTLGKLAAASPPEAALDLAEWGFESMSVTHRANTPPEVFEAHVQALEMVPGAAEELMLGNLDVALNFPEADPNERQRLKEFVTLTAERMQTTELSTFLDALLLGEDDLFVKLEAPLEARLLRCYAHVKSRKAVNADAVVTWLEKHPGGPEDVEIAALEAISTLGATQPDAATRLAERLLAQQPAAAKIARRLIDGHVSKALLPQVKAALHRHLQQKPNAEIEESLRLLPGSP
jgi:hypothetical protein